MPGFCRQKTTSQLDGHGELPTALPTALPPPCTSVPSPSPWERAAGTPHTPPPAALTAQVGQEQFTGDEAAQAQKSCCSLSLAPRSVQAGNDFTRLSQHPAVAVGYSTRLSPRALAPTFLCGLPWASPRPGSRQVRQCVSQVCSPRGMCPSGASYPPPRPETGLVLRQCLVKSPAPLPPSAAPTAGLPVPLLGTRDRLGSASCSAFCKQSHGHQTPAWHAVPP